MRGDLRSIDPGNGAVTGTPAVPASPSRRCYKTQSVKLFFASGLRCSLGRDYSRQKAYTRLMAKSAHAHPDKLVLYEMLVATNAGVELKGAAVPYTSMNGNMSSYLSNEGKLALRLPPGDIEAFLKKYKAKHCEAYGVIQKEYVEVPDELLAKTPELKKYFELSVEYVSSLKPKPTARKKTK